MTDKTKITLDLFDSILSAVVKGTEPAIVEIGQQLAWLAAALRSTPSEGGMAYSIPRATFSSGPVVSFKLDFQE